MTSKATESDTRALFDEAVKAFGETLKVGVKMQEDVAKWWSQAFELKGPVQDWQEQSRTIFAETVPAAQKNAEQWLKLVETNYRRSMDLFRSAMQANGSVAVGNGAEQFEDVGEQAQDIWKASLNLVRDNMNAMAQANMKLMELWGGALSQGAETVTQARKATAKKK